MDHPQESPHEPPCKKPRLLAILARHLLTTLACLLAIIVWMPIPYFDVYHREMLPEARGWLAVIWMGIFGVVWLPIAITSFALQPENRLAQFALAGPIVVLILFYVYWYVLDWMAIA